MITNINELRKWSGMSQSQFAERFGIPASTLRSWEQGVREPAEYFVSLLQRLMIVENVDEMFAYNTIYDKLVEWYGVQDVVRNYWSDVYPHWCSFYVKSRDLYIEDFTSWMHGYTWSEYMDDAILAEWSQKAEAGNKAYLMASRLCEGLDAEKREYAMRNKLNFVVFWEDDLSDFCDWLSKGCPDGADWVDGHDWKIRRKDYESMERDTDRKARDGFDFSLAAKAKLDVDADDEYIDETNSWFCSKNEDSLYQRLVQKFGVDDVERNYKSEVYPVSATFYIRSRDLYIELYDYPNHGGRWYDPKNQTCRNRLKKWKAEAEFDDTMTECIMVWQCVDVTKRWYAGHNDLNYVVFWKPNGSDVKRWFALGCPDGKDWDYPMSWDSKKNGEN